MTTRRPGRPRVLDPVYHRGMCDRVLKVGKKGGTQAGMALACGVTPRMIRLWRRRHEEFRVAYEMAQILSQVWWETKGEANLYSPTFKEGVWMRFMQRFDDYRHEPNVNNLHKHKAAHSSVPVLVTRATVTMKSAEQSAE